MRLTSCQQWQQRAFSHKEIELRVRRVIPGWCAPQGHPELSARSSSPTISNPHSTWFPFRVKRMNAACYCLKWLIPELRAIMWFHWTTAAGVSFTALACNCRDATRPPWLRLPPLMCLNNHVKSFYITSKSHSVDTDSTLWSCVLQTCMWAC